MDIRVADMDMFSSLCRECTQPIRNEVNLTWLSPPYRDCTNSEWMPYDSAKFLSPRGDCTWLTNVRMIPFEFSPPYGDYIDFYAIWLEERGFLPPYGDCTLNISQTIAKLKSEMSEKYLLYYNDVPLR